MSSKESGRPSAIQGRGSIVIKRTDPASMRSGGNRMSSGSARTSMSPGTFQALSNTGVTDIKGTRQKEKRDLQDLNERFASYIDKVHYLEANCKRLEAENEALRNRKEADLEPIRKMYENELSQARGVIDELTATKGNSEAKLAGLQDEVDGLRDLIVTYESQSKDYKKKIDALGNQIGEYEGELQTLRHRVGSLEDENAKIRELLKKVQDQNKALRADLDAETAAHIEADSIAQTKGEEAAFYKDLCDEFELLKPEPVQIKGMDYNEFWKSEMKKALRDINAAYDDKLDSMQMDMDAKYATQINALKNGNVKDSMTLNRAKEETTRLKGQLAEKNSAYAELATKLAALQAERDELARQMSELERELEQQKLKYNTDVGDLQDELTSVLAQLQTLMDAKMSLELEIACYKKLLEGEESRVGLRSMVEDALGSQNKGSVQNALEAALKDQSS